jgi:hypothetical protein
MRDVGGDRGAPGAEETREGGQGRQGGFCP